jgi:hypothetical protein
MMIVEDLRWPGVVVVGGGGTGLLTALELDRRGFAVLVIEHVALCSGQTGQCHGWLHRGGVFPDAPVEQADQLDRGARCWLELMEHGPESGDVMSCYLGGRQEQTLTAVSAVWRRIGLGHERADVPGGACTWSVRAPERAVVPVGILRAAVAGSGVALRDAEAVRFLPSRRGSRAAALVVRTGQRLVRLHADAFVLANGAGIATVLPDPALASGIAGRLSFMLVVRSSTVPDWAFAIPEQEALGLFGVPRTSARSRCLLLSNFLSYAVTTDISHAQANWLAGTRTTIRRFLPRTWSADDALCGVYPAVKVEPTRALALGVAGMAVLSTPFTNVSAGVPGKLVLAPLLARQLADAVAPHADPPDRRCVVSDLTSTVTDRLAPVGWGPEEWQVTPLVRRATLFDEG